jgi:hypothetical protein
MVPRRWRRRPPVPTAVADPTERARYEVMAALVSDHVRDRIADDLRALMSSVPDSPAANHFLAGLEAALEVVTGMRGVVPRRGTTSVTDTTLQ